MLLLTWHGTILRIDAGRAVLVHVPLLPKAPTYADFSLELPVSFTAPLASTDLPDIVLEPGNQPGWVHFRRGPLYLMAVPGQEVPAFTAPHKGPWESFLALPAAAIQTLRHMLAHAWTVAAPGMKPQHVSLLLEDGFKLDIAGHVLDLTGFMPIAVDAPAIDLVVDGTTLALTRPEKPLPPEILMRPLPHHRRATDTDSRDAFYAQPGKRLAVPCMPEVISLPLTMCDADRDWMYARPYAGHEPLSGPPYVRPCAGARMRQVRSIGTAHGRHGVR